MRRRPLLATPLLVAASGCLHRHQSDPYERTGNLMPPPVQAGEICPRDLPEGGMIAATGRLDLGALESPAPDRCYAYEFSGSNTLRVCAGAPGHCDRCETVPAVDHIEISLALMPLLPGEDLRSSEARCEAVGSPSASVPIDGASIARAAIAEAWRAATMAERGSAERRAALQAFVDAHDGRPERAVARALPDRGRRGPLQRPFCVRRAGGRTNNAHAERGHCVWALARGRPRRRSPLLLCEEPAAPSPQTPRAPPVKEPQVYFHPTPTALDLPGEVRSLSGSERALCVLYTSGAYDCFPFTP